MVVVLLLPSVTLAKLSSPQYNNCDLAMTKDLKKLEPTNCYAHTSSTWHVSAANIIKFQKTAIALSCYLINDYDNLTSFSAFANYYYNSTYFYKPVRTGERKFTVRLKTVPNEIPDATRLFDIPYDTPFWAESLAEIQCDIVGNT